MLALSAVATHSTLNACVDASAWSMRIHTHTPKRTVRLLFGPAAQCTLISGACFLNALFPRFCLWFSLFNAGLTHHLVMSTLYSEKSNLFYVVLFSSYHAAFVFIYASWAFVLSANSCGFCCVFRGSNFSKTSKDERSSAA